MPKEPRYLITTADEWTWKFDRPVIFLGEWCRIYDRRHIWDDMDAIVAAPYGLGLAKKDADHAEARALEEKIFPVLYNALNRFHGTQHGARFWRIVLGHWLRRYVDVMLNRVKTLEQCLQMHQISGTTAYANDHYALATQDSYAAIWAFNDDRWNSVLYMRILNLLGGASFPVQVIPGGASEGFRWGTKASKAPLKQRILKWGYQQVIKLLGSMARDSDALIINSFLPKNEEIKLQLALGQIPLWRTSPRFEPTKRPDRKLRQVLSANIAGGTSETLFGIMCSLVFELLPVCYLESFTELTEKVQQLPWLRNPKIIFTSNNFDTDEIFKLWAAKQVEAGIKYVVGQHGSNYGTLRYMYPSVEETTADKFLTWGWSDGLSQHTPAFIFKTAGRKAETYNHNGGLLLIELHAGLMMSTWDVTAEFSIYFEDQKSFIEKLQSPLRKHLTIRLHNDHIDLKWFEHERWKEFDPTLRIDAGYFSLSKLIAQSRLIIHSYDSSGILETLSQNIPTLAFWQNDLDHLREGAKPYYQLLVDAGIVHLTPESVAAKVGEIWHDVEGWWTQYAVQEARRQFCDQYARVSQNPICELKKILTN